MTDAKRLIAFDLDGTLTQHKSPLEAGNRAVLERLRQRYALLMVGAGDCQRIHRQMGGFPIDVIGNYGMQYAEYDEGAGELAIRRGESAAANREEMLRRAAVLRNSLDCTVLRAKRWSSTPPGQAEPARGSRRPGSARPHWLPRVGSAD